MAARFLRCCWRRAAFGFPFSKSHFHLRVDAEGVFIMPRTYSQAAVNAALSYLLSGGPKGGPLPKERFDYELWQGFSWPDPSSNPNPGPTLSKSATDFGSCLLLAIQQGASAHPELATAPHLYRDQFGTAVAIGSGPSWFFTGATIVG